MFRNCCSIVKLGVKQNIQFQNAIRNFIYPLCVGEYSVVRNKYINYGVQGRRNSKVKPIKKYEYDDDVEVVEKDDTFTENEYESLAKEALGITTAIQNEENVLVIQPFIKWGPKKSDVSADIKLQEAEDLIRSLDTWNIAESLTVPLLSFTGHVLFGRGKLDELRRLSRRFNGDIKRKISCVFVSVSSLSQTQKINLELAFELPVLDRFAIVVQILRAHAKSREAKLQIALAELPYIWRQMGTENSEFIRSHLTDSQKMLLRNRERKIKDELERIKVRRQMARRTREQRECPIVAVVGYTNAGKTSLIKALTNQEKIQPQNKLFATLEITAHPGRLPCNLQVIYIDTIGFMSDIPTELIQCFITTLEDAMMADLIIHVQDLAHINVFDQRQHVETTLNALMNNSDMETRKLLDNVLNVGNKCDLVENLDESIESFDGMKNENQTSEQMQFISCVKGTGIDELKKAIEINILKVTNRKKMIIRVPQGGEELTWLFKNTTVTHTELDDKNTEYIKVHLLLTDLALLQFKNTFLKKLRKEKQ